MSQQSSVRLSKAHEQPVLDAVDEDAIRRIRARRREIGTSPIGQALNVRRASMGVITGRLLYRLVRACRPSSILEVGTCVGIGAAYLGLAATRDDREVRIVGTEGVSEKHELACETLRILAPTALDWEVVLGDFDTTLKQTIMARAPFDFVYLDGQHVGSKTIRNFQWCLDGMPSGGILLADDVGNNAGMRRAGQHMAQHSRVRRAESIGKIRAYEIDCENP